MAGEDGQDGTSADEEGSTTPDFGVPIPRSALIHSKLVARPGGGRPPPPSHRASRRAERSGAGQEPGPTRGDPAGPSQRESAPATRPTWLDLVFRFRLGLIAAGVAVAASLVLAVRAPTRPDAETSLDPAGSADAQVRSGRSDPPGEGSTSSVSAGAREPSDPVGSDASEPSTTASSTAPATLAASTTTEAQATTTTVVTTTIAVVVDPPDACETQTEDGPFRGIEVKYRELDDFASSFRFYGASGQLLYSTTSLQESPSNRVFSNGYHEREWNIDANPSGFEPRDVQFVSAVEPDGESVMIRCNRV